MTELLISIVLILCPLLTLYIAQKHSINFFLSPLLLISLQILIGVTLKGILFVYSAEYRSMLFYGDLRHTIDAALYVFLFTMLLCFGYLFGIRKKIPRSAVLKAKESCTLSRHTILVLIIGSAVVFFGTTFVLAIFRSNFDGITQLFTLEGVANVNRNKIQRIEGEDSFGESFRFITVFYAITYFLFVVFVTQAGVRYQRYKNLLMAGIFLFLLFIVAEVLIRGSRNLLLEILLMFSMATLGFSRRVKFKFSYVAITAVVLVGLLVIFSLITTFRGNTNAGAGSDYTINIVTPLVETVLLKPYFMDINKISVIIAESGRYDYQYGFSLISWAVGFIPRFVWPDKPGLSLGLFVKTEIFGLRGTIGGIPPTLPGEFYINFSWFGVMLGGVCGFGLRRVEEFLLMPSRIKRYGSHWLYIFVIVTLAYTAMQAAVSLFAVRIIVSVIILIPIILFLKRKMLRVNFKT